MRNKHKEKEDECERLEAEVMSLRKQRKMEKRIMTIDSLLEIQRSPLDKFGLAFQKGEYSSHA